MWLEKGKALFMEHYPLSLVFCIACGALLVGVVNLTVLFAVGIRRCRARKAEKKRAFFRRMQYALPERENVYVRQRLKVALQNTDEDCDTQPTMELNYAKELLLRVQSADLSKAERWEVEELWKTLQLYQEKSRWSKTDCCGVSDLFSRLMKLAGKYAV